MRFHPFASFLSSCSFLFPSPSFCSHAYFPPFFIFSRFHFPAPFRSSWFLSIFLSFFHPFFYFHAFFYSLFFFPSSLIFLFSFFQSFFILFHFFDFFYPLLFFLFSPFIFIILPSFHTNNSFPFFLLLSIVLLFRILAPVYSYHLSIRLLSFNPRDFFVA